MKKLFSIFFVLVIMISVLAYAAAPELTDQQKNELKQYGIMIGDEDGDLHLDDTITRAELAKVICVAGNLDEDKIEKKCTFSDVTADSWAYKYICIASENGIINGYEDGSFKPEDSVSNEEAVKMIVSLLGYGVEADTNGGYPAGYMAAAARRGVITEKMSFGINTAAVRNDIGAMLCGALDIPLMKEEDGMYVIMDGAMYPKETLRINLEK